MKYILPAMALFASLSVFASASFEERVRAANRLEHAADQQRYQASLTANLKPKVTRLIGGCRGSLNGARPRPFVLVGDIVRSASLENIMVKPNSPFARCFASALSRVTFPKPPGSYKGDGYPFTMDMNFH